MEIDGTALLILVVVIALVAMFFLPRWRMKRAAREVIRIFRQNNATSAKSAKTVAELGLGSRNMLEGAFRGRDYKPQALTALLKGEIIQTTEDGRFYLSEDKLASSGIETPTRYSY